MNTTSSVPASTPRSAPAMAIDPVYWSVRRELWENRSLTIAPLSVGAFALFIMVMTAFGLPRRMRTLAPSRGTLPEETCPLIVTAS